VLVIVFSIIRSCFAQLIFVLSFFIFLSNDISVAHAEEFPVSIDSLITGAIEGKETGLPLPRFVSLKGKRTNMRIGPSFDHRISWVYVKQGLPGEVIEEFEIWRKIRDADGQEGWVHKALLSYRRTAIVAPWAGSEYFPIYKEPAIKAPKTAKLQGGVYSRLDECRDDWCKISGENYRGWVRAENLWGVYPGETVEE